MRPPSCCWRRARRGRSRSGRWPSGWESHRLPSICTSRTKTRCWTRCAPATWPDSTVKWSVRLPASRPRWTCCGHRVWPMCGSLCRLRSCTALPPWGSGGRAATSISPWTAPRSSTCAPPYGALMDEGVYRVDDPTMIALELWAAVHGVAALLITKPHLPFDDVEAFADRVLSAVLCGHMVAGLAGRHATSRQVLDWVMRHRSPEAAQV